MQSIILFELVLVHSISAGKIVTLLESIHITEFQ